jgi:hypothetical protein
MKFDIPQKKKLVYEMTIPIRWGDMDAMSPDILCKATVYRRIRGQRASVRIDGRCSHKFIVTSRGLGEPLGWCSHRLLEFDEDLRIARRSLNV